MKNDIYISKNYGKNISNNYVFYLLELYNLIQWLKGSCNFIENNEILY